MNLPRPPGLDGWHSKLIVKWMSSINVWLYKKTEGRWGGTFRGVPVVLLTVTGRKSGQPRTKPLLYLRDGQDVIVVASTGGMARYPQWYLNLEAHPDCSIVIDNVETLRTARTASAEEKARLWGALNELYSDFDMYQKWAGDSREIPVVILQPRG